MDPLNYRRRRVSDHKQAIKDSINLPNTTFPMKANLNQREPETIKKWKKQNTYQKMVAKNKGKKNFTMPDGPPYANGHIHMGHTLNKCLKDFVIKYKNMAGFEAPYIPGWDCHGLPIEHNITKKLGGKIREKTAQEIRLLCRDEAKQWVNIQKEEFIRLGILGDWDNPYLTLDPSYEAEEVREFARNHKNGVIIQGKKPVYWCIPLQTALAEAEIEYHNHTSPSIYVKFPYKPNKKFGSFDQPTFCVIWTTTPWTLPANQAVALNANFEYGFFKCDNEYYLIAKDIKNSFEEATGKKLTDPKSYFLGKEFELEKCQHPFMKRDSLFILGDHVTLEAGSGVVHTAPGHGQEDYQVGLLYDLVLSSPVGPDGRFTDEVPQYEGQKVFDANEVIIEDLQKLGLLVARKDITHSYPHCWRTKTPVIFRATAQWFIKMDDETYNIRKKAMAELKNIHFVPNWGVKRLTAMIENRPDWCISRQRNWGVPLPILYCTACDHPYIDDVVMEKIAVAMENGIGIEAYHDMPIEELVLNHSCESCGAKEFKKGTDILDVWFDSGICHAAVQKKREGLKFPADLYLEGSDQHRGWFQTSLLTSIASSGQAPFKSLLTHNFVNDSKGRKMSKSLGNVVDPLEIIKTSGAELLRLWAASQDYGQDMNFSKEGFERVTETYRRLRNTMRFLLGNIGDFNFTKDSINFDKMQIIDQWILGRLFTFMNQVEEHYNNYEFYKVYHALNTFFTIDLSSHYLDIIKDRLYTARTDGIERRSCQTVIYILTENLIKIMAPITSFLSEETYENFSTTRQESVFLESFPKAQTLWQNEDLAAKMELMFEVRSNASKKLEEDRANKIIGSSLEAKLDITLPEKYMTVLKTFPETSLKEFFIVSQVTTNLGPEIMINVTKAQGEKCPRCWNYDTLLDTTSYGAICPKCNEALK
jgi:isoleucyl-tRNA synthetase